MVNTSLYKTILYHYDFGHGGIADFIKFFIHLTKVANRYNCQIKIHISHPIKKYITIRSNYRIEDDNLYDYHQLNDSDSGKHIKDIISKYDKLLIIGPNLYGLDIDFELADNINFFTINDYFNNLTDYFDFNKEIYDDLNLIINNIKYICIHARLGDKYLEIKPDSSYCTDDDRSDKKYNNYNEIINDIIEKNSDKKIYLLSDNNKFKQNLKSEYDVLNIFTKDIINISCNYSISNYDESLKFTIIEFLLMCKADTIYALTYSGFSQIAHLISENKIIKYW